MSDYDITNYELPIEAPKRKRTRTPKPDPLAKFRELVAAIEEIPSNPYPVEVNKVINQIVRAMKEV